MADSPTSVLQFDPALLGGALVAASHLLAQYPEKMARMFAVDLNDVVPTELVAAIAVDLLAELKRVPGTGRKR
jgi:hypothetical protein